jgi:ribosomal protein S18 acetylase RimI-like enzyme
MKIIPFTTEHIEDAGTLLATRHRRDRAARPELPERLTRVEDARAAVKAALEKPFAEGVAAVDGGRLLGYLIGDLALDMLWGRSAWVRLPGCALAEGENTEIIRDMYAVQGDKWLHGFGVNFHFAVMSTSDPALLHTWYSLSFGIEHMHGLMDLADWQMAEPPVTAGITVRRATPEDRGVLEYLSDVIWKQQIQAPCWAIQPPERVEEQRKKWGEQVDDETASLWLAFRDGEPVGIQGFYPGEPDASDLLTPDSCIELCIAATRPEARGMGVGSRLFYEGLREAKEKGTRYALTDWRSTNLLSSRFWPKMGFQPAAYRLVRRVDNRILWGKGR